MPSERTDRAAGEEHGSEGSCEGEEEEGAAESEQEQQPSRTIESEFEGQQRGRFFLIEAWLTCVYCFFQVLLPFYTEAFYMLGPIGRERSPLSLGLCGVCPRGPAND